MSDPDFSVTLAVCSHRDIKIRAHATLWALKECPNIKVNVIIQEGDALISRSRNKVATHFLKNTQDEMICFLDDDVEISAFDYTRMMYEVHTNRYPILGAPYALKNHEKSGFAIYPIEEKGTLEMGKSGKIMLVKRVSTGAMIIRREVFEKMICRKPVHGKLVCKDHAIHFCEDSGNYAFFQHREGMVDSKWKELSEDWFFCKNALDMGFQVFLDTRPKLNHWGQFPYNFDFVALDGQYKKLDDVKLSYDLLKK